MPGGAKQTVLSPAKINLYLRVTGKRNNGYHDLDTLFCAVSLYDRMTFSFGEPGLEVVTDHADLPDGDGNLAFQAAQVFQDTSGIPVRVRIEIEKNIPIGGGLGGGSSNAAQVLKVLNAHYGNPLTQEELHSIALNLGADVPFFLYGKPAFAVGVGEELSPCKGLEKYELLLVNPGVPLNTKDVFKKLKFALTKTEKAHNYPALKNGPCDPIKLLGNDLESTAISLSPTIQEIKSVMSTLEPDGVLMSGSGPTVFALFSDHHKRDQGYKLILAMDKKWQVFKAGMIL